MALALFATGLSLAISPIFSGASYSYRIAGIVLATLSGLAGLVEVIRLSSLVSATKDLKNWLIMIYSLHNELLIIHKIYFSFLRPKTHKKQTSFVPEIEIFTS